MAITGGASGIGFALAKTLASRGAKLSIADVQEDLLAQAANTIYEHVPSSEAASFNAKEAILTSRCDVRELSQVTAWLKATVDKFGRLDHVANVAGIWRASNIDEQEEDVWDLIMGVNLKVSHLAITITPSQ